MAPSPVLLFVPEIAPNFCNNHLNLCGSVTDITAMVSTPSAPHIRPMPLPPAQTAETTRSYNSVRDILPLSLFSILTATQRNKFRNLLLVTPIHLHVLDTQDTHFGTFYGDFPGQTVGALELYVTLRSLAVQPLHFASTYCHLSQHMKSRVRATFLARTGLDESNIANIWEQFTSGQQPYSGPTGSDFLLGNVDIWGFESLTLGGYSVVHLA